MMSFVRSLAYFFHLGDGPIRRAILDKDQFVIQVLKCSVALGKEGLNIFFFVVDRHDNGQKWLAHGIKFGQKYSKKPALTKKPYPNSKTQRKF